MSTTRHLRRCAALSALACALAFAALDASASAGPLDRERYYSSYADHATSSALAQEKQYASYGETQPLTAPDAAARMTSGSSSSCASAAHSSSWPPASPAVDG